MLMSSVTFQAAERRANGASDKPAKLSAVWTVVSVIGFVLLIEGSRSLMKSVGFSFVPWVPWIAGAFVIAHTLALWTIWMAAKPDR
jgi:hypothetical protein